MLQFITEPGNLKMHKTRENKAKQWDLHALWNSPSMYGCLVISKPEREDQLHNIILELEFKISENYIHVYSLLDRLHANWLAAEREMTKLN